MTAALARALGLLVLLLAPLLGAHATPQAQTDPVPSSDAAPDRRIALRARRQQQTQVFDAQEQACYQRFFTNACLDDVARARRAMLVDIKRQEAALDAADRQQRAQEALQRQNEKQQAHDARLQATDPAALDQAQRDKPAAQDDEHRTHNGNCAIDVPWPPVANDAPGATHAPHPPGCAPWAPADTAPASPLPQAGAPKPPKPPKTPSGPSALERAANQAAFDKKQAQAQRRITERAQARAKAAASPASGPAALPPLPLPPASALAK